MKIREEFPFTLPRGIGVEGEGGRKPAGVMRLMKVKDLMAIQQDGRVKENPGYFYVILLSRVVIKLGTDGMVTPSRIERLCPEDFAFLADLVNRINHQVVKRANLRCDACGKEYIGEFGLLGEA